MGSKQKKNIEALILKVSNLESDLTEADNRRNSLQKELVIMKETRQHEIEFKQWKISSLERDKDLFSMEREKWQVEVSEKNQRIIQLMKSDEQYRKTIDELRKNKDERNKEYQSLKTTNDSLMLEKTRLKSETTRLQQLITDNEVEVTQLKDRLHELEERCKFTESCLHETSTMLENTKSLVNDEKIKMNDQLETSQIVEVDLTSRIYRLQQTINDLESDNKEQRNVICEYQDKIEELNHAYETTVNDFEIMRKEVEQCELLNEDLQLQLNIHKQLVNDKHDSLSEFTSVRLDNALKDVRKLQSQIDQAHNTKKKLNNEITALKTQLKEQQRICQIKISDMKDEKITLNDEIDRLTSQVRFLTSSNRQREKELNRLQGHLLLSNEVRNSSNENNNQSYIPPH